MATTSSDINAVCSQLLTAKDLDISQELFDRVQNEIVVIEIVDNNKTKRQ